MTVAKKVAEEVHDKLKGAMWHPMWTTEDNITGECESCEETLYIRDGEVAGKCKCGASFCDKCWGMIENCPKCGTDILHTAHSHGNMIFDETEAVLWG